MNALTPIAPNGMSRLTEAQTALIRKTVARDTNETEFDQFVHICKAVGLDPLRRQIYCFVFGKGDADKRRMTVVTGIDGYRSISARAKDYRPADKPADFEFSEAAKNERTNPLGLVRAVVTLYKFAHGQWHPVVGEAYWDEFAPLKIDDNAFDWVETGETWPDSGKPKKKKVRREGVEALAVLDPDKTGWIKSPRNQLAKCAEAQAHRKGWPNDFSGLYVAEEIDRSHTIDLTASQMADAGDRASRFKMIGGPNAVMIDWMDGEPLQRVPAGQFADQALAFIAKHMKKGEEEPSAVLGWLDRNRHSINEFWALDKDAALALKKELEKVEAMAKAAP
jgi:phage recombination protein Bet